MSRPIEFIAQGRNNVSGLAVVCKLDRPFEDRTRLGHKGDAARAVEVQKPRLGREVLEALVFLGDSQPVGTGKEDRLHAQELSV